MKRLNRIFFFLGFCSLFLGCEEEGAPLTLGEIYRAQEADRPPFKAILNGKGFTTENAGATKQNELVVISGSNSDGEIALFVTDFLAGKYSAEINSLNQIAYTDMYGKRYVSDRGDKISDAEVDITFYDDKASTISGRFSAVLYDSEFEKPDIYLSNGTFNNLFVNIPFFGRMKAGMGEDFFDSDQCAFRTVFVGGEYRDRISSLSSNDTSRMFFEVAGSMGVGQYVVDDSSFIATCNVNAYGSASETLYRGKSGTVTVNSLDRNSNRIQGVFNFQGINAQGDTIEITDGEFNALIQQ